MTEESALLDAVLSATRDGRLVWALESPGRYRATGIINIVIQEVCPLIAGETETVGVQAFQVEVNCLVLTFWDGTEACCKIRAILAAGLTEFTTHASLVSDRIQEVIERLSIR